nr:hypothetical protein [Saccharopolyspora pogona]
MGEVERQIGQRVEQSDVVARGFARFGAGSVVELSHACQRGRLLGFQLVVGAAQCFGERVVGITVLCLPQDRVLAAGDVGERALEAFAFCVAFASGPVIDAVEIGRQGCAPVGAEYSLGEEAGNRIEHGIFAEVDGFVAVVLVRATAVVVSGPAQVVGPVVALTAEHSPSAAAEHHAPEQVGPSRLRVGVVVVACAGASFGLAAGGHLVEHPLRDQRFVRRLGRPHPLDRVVDLALLRA